MTKYDGQKLQTDLVFIFQYGEDDDKIQAGPNGEQMKRTENKGLWNEKDKNVGGQSDEWNRDQCASLRPMSLCH